MAYDVCNCCFQFWAIFCPFTPLTAQKMNTSKKFTKHLEMSSFYTSVPKIMIICYTVLEIRHVMYVIIVFNFGQFFALSTSLTAQKIKISWKSKKVLEISSSHTCVPKIMIRWCSVPEIRCMTHRSTDIQMDGGTKKWHIEVGAPPKKRRFAITNIKTGLFLRGM